MASSMTQRPPPSPTSVMDVNAKSLMVSFSPEETKRSKTPRRPGLEHATLVLSTRELQHQTSSFASTYWHVLVGMAAFFDFCATVLAPYFPEDDGPQTITTKGLFFDRHHQEYVVTDDPLLYDCLQWLDSWYVSIGVVFSILWFWDAIVKAQWKRDEKMDRQRLLDNEDSYASASQRAFYYTLAFQILVLPVGFYVAVWNVLTLRWNSKDEAMEECEDGSIGMRSTHSLLFAGLNYAFMTTNRLVGIGIRSRRKALSRRIAKRMAKFAVRHPRLFRHRLRVSLCTVRWVKYLLPLIGGVNKLLSNTKDLLKKQRQRVKATRAAQRRKKKWQELSPIEKRMAAAIMIQKSFRGIHSRRAVRALHIMEGCKKTMIAIKMQKAFRASLARARERIARNKLELKRLQAQAAASTTAHNESEMSDDDRRRMYQLQDELGQQAKELVNKKLLLRPNTTFAVTWKFLFVLCVLYEIAMKALKHKLNDYRDKETGEPMDLSLILEQKLVPDPITEWEECAPWFEENGKASSFILESCPWYCQEHVVFAQSIFILLLRFFLSSAPWILGTICFLDVFVTFFTGEIHSENGMLLPKPFIKRWLLPGLVLQLLVNPQMETTSKYVGKVMTGIMHVGPVRAWRWTAALWYPLFKSIVRVMEYHVWVPLVRQQNQKLQERKAEQTSELVSLESKARRTSFSGNLGYN